MLNFNIFKLNIYLQMTFWPNGSQGSTQAFWPRFKSPRHYNKKCEGSLRVDQSGWHQKIGKFFEK